jgi:hypothetical protein
VIALVLLLIADLEVVSVVPSTPNVVIDETFQITVHVRNNGPEAAPASVAAGANAGVLLRGITGPAGWTCETDTPRFGYALNCAMPSMAAKSEAQFVMTLTAPQHSAVTYRVSALASTPSDPVELNNRVETTLGLDTSEMHAELALIAQPETNGRAKFEVRNNGPHNATDVVVVFGENVSASGAGWKCGAPGKTVACSRAALAPGVSTTITVTPTAPAGTTVPIDGRVRAEKIYDENGRNNAAMLTVTAEKPAKSKRRAVRP